MTTTTQHIVCPYCGYKADRASGVGKEDPGRPHAGAIALCIACGRPGVYVLHALTGRLLVRAATDNEYADMIADDTIATTMFAIRAARERSDDWPMGTR